MSRFGPILIVCLFFGPPTFACSVPVFRYALERWQPAKYDLVAYHRGPLGQADGEALRRLQSVAARANARVTAADLDGQIDPNLRAVWDREGAEAALPRLMLRYPDAGPQVPSAWSGPLSAAPEPILASPARRAIFDRLTAGHAAVLVLLLSGDPSADEAARQLLRTELPRIAARIDLPPPTEDGPQLQSELPLWIDFSVFEVTRAPAEDALVRLLLGSEDGLADVKGPIAFPVFGRGRALCSLHGKDLADPAELGRSLEFLCKACSCQVKELNPGVDLLMTANWDVVFDAERGPAAREVAAGSPPAAETRASPMGEATTGEARPPPLAGYSAAKWERTPRPLTSRSPLLRLGTTVAGLVVLATGFWAFRGRRSPPPPGP